MRPLLALCWMVFGSVGALLAQGEAPPLPPSGASVAAEPLDPVEKDGVPWFIDHSRPLNRVWARGEYLLWWVDGLSVPSPLVSTGAGGGGALGRPDTAALFGGEDMGLGAFSGGRLEVGWWADPEQVFGVEVGGFLLERRGEGVSLRSDPQGSPLLALPYFDPPTAQETAHLLADPGQLQGGVTAEVASHLWGVDTSMSTSIYRCGQADGYLLFGATYTDLLESLTLAGSSQRLDGQAITLEGSPLTGGTLVATTVDRFAARSQFYGVHLGVRGEVRRGRFLFDAQGKVGVGVTHQAVDVSGRTGVTGPGTSLSAPGGIFAQPSNMGRRTHNAFTVLPEVRLRLGVEVTRGMLLFVGYDCLYWSSVVRPGEQVDRAVATPRIPLAADFDAGAGPTRPLSRMEQTDFWAQGLLFGLEWRY